MLEEWCFLFQIGAWVEEKKKKLDTVNYRQKSQKKEWKVESDPQWYRVQDGSCAWAWRAWDEEIEGEKQSSLTALKFAQFLLKVEK